MPRVVHFEIHAEDPERAVNFYKSVFEWDIRKWEGIPDYFLVTTGAPNEPGINGAIIRRRGVIDGTAVIAYVCTIEVSALDEYLARVATNGGSTVVAKMAVPMVGWLAYCKDTEGNIFGVTQPDPNAH